MHDVLKARCPSIRGVSHLIGVLREELVLFIGGLVPYYVFYCNQCSLLTPVETDQKSVELLEVSGVRTVRINPIGWLGEVWPEGSFEEKRALSGELEQLGNKREGVELATDVPDYYQPEDKS